jgi:hypothetical protein
MFSSFGGLLPTSIPTNPGKDTCPYGVSHPAAVLWLNRHLLKFPFAADDYRQGVYRQHREEALTRAHIQHTPRKAIVSLVIDIDHEDAVMAAYRTDLPRPSWVTESPSGRAHAGYLLKVPVMKDRRRKAKWLAAHVEAALIRELQGDASYPALITKNPFHPYWETRWGTDELHTLSGMAEQLRLKPALPISRLVLEPGDAPYGSLGRNCQLFESTRVWAYEAVRRYWGDDPTAFRDAVSDHVMILNSQLTTPLSRTEAWHIAKSVSSWTWATMTPDKFAALQKERGQRSGAVRTRKAAARSADVLDLRAQGMTWQQVADSLGISYASAQNVGKRAAQNLVTNHIKTYALDPAPNDPS